MAQVLCADDETWRCSLLKSVTDARGSSYPYLENFPIDELKIDSSFMRQLKDNGVNRATIESQRAAFDRIDKTRNGRRGA